jgi:tetratricopeptide (TPR) repeat protein
MRKNLKIRLIIILFLFIFASSCQPQTKIVVKGRRTEAISPPVLPVEDLDKKITHLTRILDEKTIKGKDREIALELLAVYRMIRSELQAQSPDYDYRKVINSLFTALSRVDEKYFLKEGFDEQKYPEVITLFSRKKKKILDDYLSGDHQGVINECLELVTLFGPDSLSPEIGLLFAISLAKEGNLKDAINIADRIGREFEGKPGLIHLRANIIEWQVELGNSERALELYEKLMDDQDEIDAVFQRAGQMVRGEKKFAHREKISDRDYSTGEGRGPERESMEELLSGVNELIQRYEFKEAKLLLIKQRIRFLEGPEIETIDQAFKSVELAEKSFLMEKKDRLTQEEEVLNLARKLFEEENFEAAIAKLEELDDGQDTNNETRKLKDLATEKLINRERNNAAKIFLKARKTTDLRKKEELLFSSYEILKVLIEKYPTSDLIDKLNNHLKSVKKELKKLGRDPG